MRPNRGDHVTGTTRNGTPVSGKVDYADREMGIKLESGGFIPEKRLETVNGAAVGGAALKKWAEKPTEPRHPDAKYRTLGVLAGRYRGKDVSSRPLLTHAFFEGKEKSACGRMKEDDCSDLDTHTLPTCAACRAKVSK